MQRSISAFVQDEVSDWVACLDCGHRQHVRHHPPLVSRPWVTSAEGRNAKLGARLECIRCNRFEMPDGFAGYKRTPVLTELTVPSGLRRDHSTASGVWAKIQVLEGQLRYRVDELRLDVVLTATQRGIVVPEVRHSVEPEGAVRFFVEFYRAPPNRPI
ncbi:DUF3565 domain-containing protein [Variovorax sp. J22R24]|uniref:DUF3565 domain-containing protein n=1 Tax=Variovorax gracilis TaxID=3053502 RepID=UPI002574A85C|nr:DUF3565 domain-containing protein [Variovorax sp. J22R24]MDM0108799.1 DUF3565 domain-containing protein [Variovorax sp. J22R24]